MWYLLRSIISERIVKILHNLIRRMLSTTMMGFDMIRFNLRDHQRT